MIDWHEEAHVLEYPREAWVTPVSPHRRLNAHISKELVISLSSAWATSRSPCLWTRISVALDLTFSGLGDGSVISPLGYVCELGACKPGICSPFQRPTLPPASKPASFASSSLSLLPSGESMLLPIACCLIA